MAGEQQGKSRAEQLGGKALWRQKPADPGKKPQQKQGGKNSPRLGTQGIAGNQGQGKAENQLMAMP